MKRLFLFAAPLLAILALSVPAANANYVNSGGVVGVYGSLCTQAYQQGNTGPNNVGYGSTWSSQAYLAGSYCTDASTQAAPGTLSERQEIWSVDYTGALITLCDYGTRVANDGYYTHGISYTATELVHQYIGSCRFYTGLDNWYKIRTYAYWFNGINYVGGYNWSPMVPVTW